jgi:hypothetical protein
MCTASCLLAGSAVALICHLGCCLRRHENDAGFGGTNIASIVTPAFSVNLADGEPMSTASDNDESIPDNEADRRADAMKDQLRKDVASWSAARSEGSVRRAEEFSVPLAKPSPPQPTTRAKRPKPVSPDASKPSSAPKKPFSMSYDGMTEAEYIRYMIARGAR